VGPAVNAVIEDERNDERVSFLGGRLPEGFVCREVTIECGSERPYDAGEWGGAIVVVEEGELELECQGGSRARFASGSILFFEALGLLTLRNPGDARVLLTAVTRPQVVASPTSDEVRGRAAKPGVRGITWPEPPPPKTKEVQT
jgi:hypothetical protein